MRSHNIGVLNLCPNQRGVVDAAETQADGPVL